MQRTRLFLAVWPSPEVVGELLLLPRKSSPSVRFVPPENWHVTLRFIGEADIATVVERIDPLQLPRCEVRLGPIVDMLGEHSAIVDAAGLEGLVEPIEWATADLGEPPRRRFRGHLTLARIPRSARRHRPADVVGTPFRSRFAVETVCLVNSRLGADGARYEVVAQWACERTDPAGLDRA